MTGEAVIRTVLFKPINTVIGEAVIRTVLFNWCLQAAYQLNRTVLITASPITVFMGLNRTVLITASPVTAGKLHTN